MLLLYQKKKSVTKQKEKKTAPPGSVFYIEIHEPSPKLLFSVSSRFQNWQIPRVKVHLGKTWLRVKREEVSPEQHFTKAIQIDFTLMCGVTQLHL